MPNPWLGPSYALNSKPASVQRTMNLIPVPIEPGNERTDWTYRDVPGLVLSTQSAGTGIIRGLWTHNNVLYQVNGATLYQIDSNGAAVSRGTLNSTAGFVDFASTLTQLVISDGSYLYVWNPSIGSFTVVANYLGGDRISFLDQRINFLYRGTQQFGWTSIGDATIISPLDFASAESSPDIAISQLAFQNELWIAGTESMEIFDPTADVTNNIPIVYEKSSAAIDFGCAAAQSLQKTPNAVYWLSRDKNGSAMVLSGVNHSASRVSTRYQEERFGSAGDLSQASAFTYTSGGHSFYCLNVPGLDAMQVWDETFQQWHERAEWVNNGYTLPVTTCHAYAYNRHYFGCGTVMATSSASVSNNLGNPLRRQRIAPVIASADNKRHSFPLFEVICEKATNASLMLRWSDDDAHTWSNTHTRNTGAVGQYNKRVRWTRLGNSRERVFDLSCTDNAPFNPVMVNIPIV